MSPLCTSAPTYIGIISSRSSLFRSLLGGRRSSLELTGSDAISVHSATPVHAWFVASPDSPVGGGPSTGRHGQRPDPPEHRPEQAAGQVALGQQQPAIACVRHQPPAGLDEALLQAGQRPALYAPWQHPPPPQVAPVVGEHAQLQPDLVRPEPVTRQPRPMRGLLAFLDSLLGGPALVVEPHDRAIRDLEIGHDEADAREQLAWCSTFATTRRAVVQLSAW